MEITEKSVEQALELARENRWNGSIPIVRAQLRLAVNSLLGQDRRLFTRTPQEIVSRIQQKRNCGIKKILRKYNVEALAFAIRDALN